MIKQTTNTAEKINLKPKSLLTRKASYSKEIKKQALKT